MLRLRRKVPYDDGKSIDGSCVKIASPERLRVLYKKSFLDTCCVDLMPYCDSAVTQRVYVFPGKQIALIQVFFRVQGRRNELEWKPGEFRESACIREIAVADNKNWVVCQRHIQIAKELKCRFRISYEGSDCLQTVSVFFGAHRGVNRQDLLSVIVQSRMAWCVWRRPVGVRSTL